MIKVKVEKNEFIKHIQIKGHAMYEKKGKDIVCAGVSSIITTTINGILRIDKKAISYSSKDGFVLIHVLKEDKITEILLQNMIDLLKQLEKDYKKNIKIEEVPLWKN